MAPKRAATPKKDDPTLEQEVSAEADAKSTKHVYRKKKKPEDKKKGGFGLLNAGSNVVTLGILLYAGFVANRFRHILYPAFPEDQAVLENMVKPGDEMIGKLWIADTSFPKEKPHFEFRFKYATDDFEAKSKSFNITTTPEKLKRGLNVMLSATVEHAKTGKGVRAVGSTIKKMKKPDVAKKYLLLKNEECPAEIEPGFGAPKRNKYDDDLDDDGPTHIARGIPKMQVRLVYDTTKYPQGWKRPNWFPELFVDEFWMTDDMLVKLNTTERSKFETEATFSLMSAARRRFQMHMEHSFSINAKVFGDDSEEMLQMRDLFANTNSYLLVATLVVSVLHILFEFLAFKNDVIFFQSVDTETLNKFVSVQSIAVGIFAQIVVLMYLWDEGSNVLVLITSLASIAIDAWKVQRAMKVCWFYLFGLIPCLGLESKVKLQKADDFDGMAMRYMALGLLPFVACYGVYTLTFDCHKGWYSYVLCFSASCVYSLGFVLMTPQVFINYKHKTVAFLPWRKFIYRALNTFIDDLFAFIIRMPTMHRLSCFRDDIVFLVYLYQRQIYSIDSDRSFDEDGYEIVEDKADEKPEGKKDK